METIQETMLNVFRLFRRAEREKYYKHGEKAKAKPSKYLSITIDGMDQGKHNLPHINTATKVIKRR